MITRPARATALGTILLLPTLLLDYGLFYEPEMLDDWAAQRDALAASADAWASACEPADTADPNGDCNLDLQQLVRDVNGLKQTWLTFDNSEWDDTSLSGMVALKPTRDATLAASNSGGAWLDDCAYTDGGDDCIASADAFVGDVETLNREFADWPY